MIVVTGATGNVGRPLVQKLAAAGAEVRAISRSLTASDVPDGVQHRQGDLARPAELGAALDGVDALFLLLSGEFLSAGVDFEAVMSAVRDAGVQHVVLLSSQGVGTGNHPDVFEQIVKGSGVEWTMLRPGNFATNAFQWAESIRTERTVAAPFPDVELPAIDPADIAAVAATVLLGDRSHRGEIYELTGPRAISPRQQANAIATAIGEPVRFVELTRAQAKSHMVQFMPEPVAESTLDLLGTPAPALQRVSGDIERLLGRAPHTFADWADRNAAAFK